MRAAGSIVEAVPTTGPQTAGSIARACADNGADLILVAGGDGTINEAVNGMVYSPIPIGVLPGGTANVLAMELGLGRNVEKIARNISSLQPVRVAAGLIETGGTKRHFLLMAGFGLDAHIIYNLNLDIKARLGKVAYWIGGFGQVGQRLPEFEVKVNGATYRASFALASRVRNYGGDLSIARSITLMENQFELILFEGSNSFKYLIYFTGVLTGTVSKIKGIRVIHTTEASFGCPTDPRVHSQIDGEYSGPLPARISIVPDALTLLLPEAYLKKARTNSWTTSRTLSQA